MLSEKSNLHDRDGLAAPLLARHALYRGLYSRVAHRTGVDPSYVSRVGRGQRRSPKIERALMAELKRVESAR